MFPFVGNEPVFPAEFPVGEEALLPFTVPLTPTETGIVNLFKWILVRTSNMRHNTLGGHSLTMLTRVFECYAMWSLFKELKHV